MRSRLSVRQHARLTGFVLTLGAALAFPRAITAQPQSPETPRAAEVVERVPLYFEPLPDGSFLARRIGRTIRISGAEIRIARTPASGVEASGPIGIRFAGARRGLSVEGISQQRGRVNYLLGNDAGKWRTNVRTYARARIRDLYPGIDVEYYGAPDQLSKEAMRGSVTTSMSARLRSAR